MSNQNKPIRAYDAFYTNIKGLPEGEYMTQTMYSDTAPWRVVSRTATTVTLQPVLTERDPEWKPNIIAGGFAGHCTNQDEQTWLYAGLGEHTTIVRLVKSRYYGSDKLWRSKQAGEFIANGAVRKHDYNF
jgi:hypothetical protein